MRNPCLFLCLSFVLGGCANAGQNALMSDMLSRAMAETALSSGDQGLAVKTVKVMAQSAGEHAAEATAGTPAGAAEAPVSAGEGDSW